MARDPVVAPVAFIIALGTGAVSVLHAIFVLTSEEFDRASPVPGYQRWIAVAGAVAAVAFLALLHHGEGLGEVGGWVIAMVVLVGVTCALPWWHHRSTVDVTPTGFHRAAYTGYWFDLYVYNATDTPVVISIGADTRFPARLRPPGRTVAPHDRVALTWPADVYGTFTLTVTGPLAPGARGSTTVTRERAPERVTV